jgi:hypothetical protein
MDFKYVPIFRVRQQEIIVLKSYDFGNKIYPLIEVIKEKDRKNNNKSTFEIYSELINDITADKVFLDLPVYLRINNSTNDEVVAFSRAIIEDIVARIAFFNQFAELNERVVPVISSLLLKTGEVEIERQVQELRGNFPTLAFRTFHNTFEGDLAQINDNIEENDYFMYDLDTTSISNPLFRRHRRVISDIGSLNKIVLRSAINTDIQNVKLDHGNIISEADNILLEEYSQNGIFGAFGDYVGVKKDDLTSGGTISPGFIIYDPYENMYYGYKGTRKSLSEFEDTIVPNVLDSEMMTRLQTEYQYYIEDNEGIKILENIRDGGESGKSQAKFKKVSIAHYLHCMRTNINADEEIPLY